MSKQPTQPRKQRGAISLDALIVIGVVILALIFVISQAPKLTYAWNKFQYGQQAASIEKYTRDWQRGRSNFATVDISKVCATTDLDRKICGPGNNGVATNPFGGNWSVTANSNPGLFDVTGTLPNDTNRIIDIADTMAPSTRGNCQESTGCSTLSTSATGVTMTY
ncbi:hypothetical protein MD535_22300 [Vibrio sp. ZSDZ65]|uniref:Uncharacterized protein n=1 Tax=Vibrio qingdaonensis TaxID=2829491 RepID=A0A9X3HYT1_9VIBR|nr:hypothetical protein [Vibrio qingdaonensis]MCW8348724.1 hypothetical protein [Vibrio qingdaonensis]